MESMNCVYILAEQKPKQVEGRVCGWNAFGVCVFIIRLRLDFYYEISQLSLQGIL